VAAAAVARNSRKVKSPGPNSSNRGHLFLCAENVRDSGALRSSGRRKALGIDPRALDAIRAEGTPVLPEVDAQLGN